MQESMRKAFQVGSGVDPLAMKVVVIGIAVAVILVSAVWILVQLAEAHANQDLTTADVVRAGIQLLIIVSLTLYVVM